MKGLKKNKEMSKKYLGLTIYNSQNKQFPYFVEEWDECFTEEEIRGHWEDMQMISNIYINGEQFGMIVD